LRRTPTTRHSAAATLIVLALAACGGGGGGGGGAAVSVPPPAVTPTPTPAATGTPFPGASVSLLDAAGTQALASYAGYGGGVALSPERGSASVTVTELTSLIPPVAVPSIPPDATTGVTPEVLVYFTFTPSAAITLEAQPTLVVTLPAVPPLTASLNSAYYDTADASAGWVVSSPGRPSVGTTQVTLNGSSIAVPLTANAAYVGVVLEDPNGNTTSMHARRR
jgi:hypothetical protein